MAFDWNFHNLSLIWFYSSGLWTSSYFLGSFVGPTLSGILVDQVGFRATSLILFSICCGSIIMDSVQLFFIFKTDTSSSKYQELK
jgi:MFS family permease